MNLVRYALQAAAIAALGLATISCDGEVAGPCASGAPASAAAAAPSSTSAPAAAAVKIGQLGPSVWLETEGKRRRVLVGATVCLRQGSYGLETLLCRRRTKEHESILTTDADARIIHLALVAAGAQPGSPVQFEPKFKPPSGSQVKVSLEYESKGKLIRVPAQHWIMNTKTHKDLDSDWVFAGSLLEPNPDDSKKEPLYAANLDGAYICVSNVPTAMLDLPINSPKGLEDRSFDIRTEGIPALDTKVTVILEPDAPARK